jgi:hypothetical protein
MVEAIDNNQATLNQADVTCFPRHVASEAVLGGMISVTLFRR